ncbi:MAG: undecaprenyldiphospho-muramoylpentapeptide beta-N-acetylglucosaminyltransferase [Alphaproteobacteria bacterium]|nr:undecaprenyldiphospho-muramoylpentapeptide beta-N-acetylglucosaminyltransferase [Alphaproteobacteria bacterium]
MPKIIFTGGGSAGHITLNLALIPYFIDRGWQIFYIGSQGGMEEELIKKYPSVKYHSILTGKLRRYFSLQNILDMVKIPIGCVQAMYLIHKINPDIIFSKGGFVSFPVVIGGFLNRKKIFMHESDITPGLANKMSLPFVSTFFTTFEETINTIKHKNKVQCVGPVLSSRLFDGNKEQGAKFAHLCDNKPTIMFIGGSLGAQSLNNAVAQNLSQLLKKYQVIHIAGKNGYNPQLKREGYQQYEYVDTELKDLMALADVVISRAGSNSIFELASLNKPMILVPLPNTSSRGEQTLNAKNFVAKGYAEMISDTDVAKPEILLPLIDKVYEFRQQYQQQMREKPVKITTAEKLSSQLAAHIIKSE